MPVDLVLVGTHRGAPRETSNPLTGLPETRAPLVMNDDELRAFRAVLARYGIAQDACSGRLSIEQTTIHLDALGIEGARASVDGDVGPAASFLFDLATAAELLILQHGGCVGTTATALARVRDLDEEFGVAAIATDAPSLARLLTSQTDPEHASEIDLDL